MKEKRKANKQNIENVLEKLQRKTVDVMGPLSKLWSILEGAKEAECYEFPISSQISAKRKGKKSHFCKKMTNICSEKSPETISLTRSNPENR